MSVDKPTLADLKAEMTAVKKRMCDMGKAALEDAFREFLAKHPEVVVIRWDQYTPYFNDGEPCEFSVGEMYFGIPDGKFSKVPEYAEEEHEDPELGTVGLYSASSMMSDYYRTKFGDVWTQFRGLREDARALTESMDEELLRIAFDDHVRVVVTREGIDVQDYSEHD